MSAREMTPTTSSAWRRADAGPRALSSAPPPLSCLAVSLPPFQQGATNRTLLPPPIGTAPAAVVASLALLAAASGFCAGCEIYRLSARLRGISPTRHSHIQPSDFGLTAGHGRAFVEFTHPLCGECRAWERRLASEPDPLVKVDVRERPELARKDGIAVVPAVFALAADGTVLERLAP